MIYPHWFPGTFFPVPIDPVVKWGIWPFGRPSPLVCFSIDYPIELEADSSMFPMCL
jgi:hypothetical protein